MKTTIDIPDDMLAKLMKNTKSRTKREAVLTAISELNRRRQLSEATRILGTFSHFMDPQELDRMRDSR